MLKRLRCPGDDRDLLHNQRLRYLNRPCCYSHSAVTSRLPARVRPQMTLEQRHGRRRYPDGVALGSDGSFWVAILSPPLPALQALAPFRAGRWLAAWVLQVYRPPIPRMGMVVQVRAVPPTLLVRHAVTPCIRRPGPTQTSRR